jgi:hypothetical protein
MAAAAKIPLHCNLAVPDDRLDPWSNEDCERSVHDSQSCNRVRALWLEQLISVPVHDGVSLSSSLVCCFVSVFLSLVAKGLCPSNVPHCVDNAVTRYPRFPNVGALKEIDRYLLILRIAPILLKALN